MKREFKVEATVGKPQVAYRETIRRRREPRIHPQEADRWFGSVREGRHLLQPEHRPETGVGAATSSSTTCPGGRVPREYIPSVDQGSQDAMEFGVLAGYPMVDVKVTLLDGAYHDVDSSELAFKIAGNQAFKGGRPHGEAGPARADVRRRGHHPEDFLGDVIGDINSRRGQIQAGGAPVTWSSTPSCRCRRCSGTLAT